MSNHLKNSAGTALDVDIVKARLSHQARGSVQPLLSGTWHVQTIGDPSPVLQVQLLCSYSTVQTLIGYASTKESLHLKFDGAEYEGVMLAQPSYDIYQPRPDRRCSVDLQLAVTG